MYLFIQLFPKVISNTWKKKGINLGSSFHPQGEFITNIVLFDPTTKGAMIPNVDWFEFFTQTFCLLNTSLHIFKGLIYLLEFIATVIKNMDYIGCVNILSYMVNFRLDTVIGLY